MKIKAERSFSLYSDSELQHFWICVGFNSTDWIWRTNFTPFKTQHLQHFSIFMMKLQVGF